MAARAGKSAEVPGRRRRVGSGILLARVSGRWFLTEQSTMDLSVLSDSRAGKKEYRETDLISELSVPSTPAPEIGI